MQVTFLLFHVYGIYSPIKKAALRPWFVNTHSLRNKMTTIKKKGLQLTCNTGRGPGGVKGFYLQQRKQSYKTFFWYQQLIR